MYTCSYALFLKEMLMFRLHSSQDFLIKDEINGIIKWFCDSFPWQDFFPDMFQIPRHFQVFQTSDHPISPSRMSRMSLLQCDSVQFVNGINDPTKPNFRKCSLIRTVLTHCCHSKRLQITYLEIVIPVTFFLSAASVFINVHLLISAFLHYRLPQ